MYDYQDIYDGISTIAVSIPKRLNICLRPGKLSLFVHQLPGFSKDDPSLFREYYALRKEGGHAEAHLFLYLHNFDSNRNHDLETCPGVATVEKEGERKDGQINQPVLGLSLSRATDISFSH